MADHLKVVEFTPPISGRILSNSDREDFIQTLQNIIDEVREGKIIGISGVVPYPDSGTMHFRHGYQTTAMVGRMEMLKHKIVVELLNDK